MAEVIPQARVLVLLPTYKARRLKAKRPGLRLIERSGPAGRGLAGKDGFLYALRRPEVEAVVEMDADFSHQPRHVPQLLAALKNADMAVGSRRAPGGKDNDRVMARRVLTFLANFYARTLLGLPVRDTNSGFRAYTRKALEAISSVEFIDRKLNLLLELFRAVETMTQPGLTSRASLES